MRSSIRCFAFASFACLAACSTEPRDDSVALEFDFESSTAPTAWIDVGHVVSPSGITLEKVGDGQAARFDGSGASIDVTNVDLLPLTSALAIEMNVNVADWKNPYAGSAAIETIVSHSDDFTLSVLPTTWMFRAELKSNEGKVQLEGGNARLGSWQHVALVLDESDSIARLYIDGVVVDQRVVHGRFALTPGIPVRIGTWFKQNQAFCGALDDVRIWRRALTAGEVAEHARSIRPNT